MLICANFLLLPGPQLAVWHPPLGHGRCRRRDRRGHRVHRHFRRYCRTARVADGFRGVRDREGIREKPAAQPDRFRNHHRRDEHRAGRVGQV